MNERYICIHGHFYQPPRENPWLEEVELQDSAYPYHDWNARINAECYAPNTASRILGADRRIIDIVNNFSKISFNFGPTLMSWFKRHDREVYEKIVEADRVSQHTFSGHGAAIAQCYNHLIMPLASSRDKRTQIYWGIQDFQSHFQRAPEGMWLPETAVDIESLELLAEYGIKYTILSPRQANRVRKMGETEWHDVRDETIDPRRAYLCNLPSGKQIALFFYDGNIAKGVAFENLLNNGEEFANRLCSVYTDDEEAQLSHIATDGETYGHHKSYGDMVLSYCLYHIDTTDNANITIYGEFLEKHPPCYEVEIFENSSWSCVHGIERWRNDCGCNSGMHPGWHQKWRAPLRGALDWLSDNINHVYEQKMKSFTDDPWLIRNEYIAVLLNRDDEHVQQFLNSHANRELSMQDMQTMLKLLELQRHEMLIYTSCGWFFDEISGIEPSQVLEYAARAIQLCAEVSSLSLEDTFIKLLERAPSNLSSLGNGAQVYREYIQPAELDLFRVGAHYAVSFLFEDYPSTARIYSYNAHCEFSEVFESGKQKLVIGKAHLRSLITWDESPVTFAVLHLGDHNLIGGVREYLNEETFEEVYCNLKESFHKSDIAQTMRLIEQNFSSNNYSLWHLFKDEQRKILNQVLDTTLHDVEITLRHLNDIHYPIIQVMKQLHVPLPKTLSTIAQLLISTDLTRVVSEEQLDVERLKELTAEAEKWSIDFDTPELTFRISNRINILLEAYENDPANVEMLAHLNATFNSAQPLNLTLDIWRAQNVYFSTGKQLLEPMRTRAAHNDEYAKSWIEEFNNLGHHLKVRIE